MPVFKTLCVTVEIAMVSMGHYTNQAVKSFVQEMRLKTVVERWQIQYTESLHSVGSSFQFVNHYVTIAKTCINMLSLTFDVNHYWCTLPDH